MTEDAGLRRLNLLDNEVVDECAVPYDIFKVRLDECSAITKDVTGVTI
jgi:hypothetical protein